MENKFQTSQFFKRKPTKTFSTCAPSQYLAKNVDTKPHVSYLYSLNQHADENMMDAYNLAICFGPTLMPAPEEKDQVQSQNQVNDLIKNMIVFHEDLFPKDLGGSAYEKYISQEPFDCDVGDSPTEQVTEDPDSEVYPSEDGK